MSELHINMMNIMEQSCIDDYFEEEKNFWYISQWMVAILKWELAQFLQAPN